MRGGGGVGPYAARQGLVAVHGDARPAYVLVYDGGQPGSGTEWGGGRAVRLRGGGGLRTAVYGGAPGAEGDVVEAWDGDAPPPPITHVGNHKNKSESGRSRLLQSRRGSPDAVCSTALIKPAQPSTSPTYIRGGVCDCAFKHHQFTLESVLGAVDDTK